MVVRKIKLTEEEDQRLERVAAREGRTVSELLRERVDAVLQEEARQEELRRRALASIGQFRSGLPDLATNHDHYLAEDFL